MKKTIAILLATAGIAMAGSSGMMDITMDSHAYSMEDLGLTDIGSKNVTVAMQLDWQTLKGLDSGEYIFKISGDTTRPTQGGTLGMGVSFVGETLYIGTTTGPNYTFTTSGSLRVNPDLTQDVTLAVLVYTAKDHTSANRTDVDFYLYLWGKGSDTPLTLSTNDVNNASYVKGTNYTSYISTYDGINISANLVEQAEVYDEFISATQADAIAREFYDNFNAGSGTGGTDTTVPEPATATLSLLALGALAARRRRK